MLFGCPFCVLEESCMKSKQERASKSKRQELKGCPSDDIEKITKHF